MFVMHWCASGVTGQVQTMPGMQPRGASPFHGPGASGGPGGGYPGGMQVMPAGGRVIQQQVRLAIDLSEYSILQSIRQQNGDQVFIFSSSDLLRSATTTANV